MKIIDRKKETDKVREIIKSNTSVEVRKQVFGNVCNSILTNISNGVLFNIHNRNWIKYNKNKIW